MDFGTLTAGPDWSSGVPRVPRRAPDPRPGSRCRPEGVPCAAAPGGVSMGRFAVENQEIRERRSGCPYGAPRRKAVLIGLDAAMLEYSGLLRRGGALP